MTAVQRANLERDARPPAERTWPRLAADTRPGAAPQPGPTCWGLTEGAAGMVSQVAGLAAAIGFPYVHHNVEMRWPFSTMWPGFLPAWNGVFSDRSLVEPGEPPRVVISCGRLGSAASLALKRRFGSAVFTIHVQDPKLPIRWFDLIVAPAHDGLYGDNVVQSLGAVHPVTAARLRAAVENGPAPALARLGEPFVGVLLGGPNRYYAYSSADINCLIRRLRSLVERDGVRLAILPSRRTPAAALERFRTEFGADHLVWDRRGDNPYLSVLALASHLIVTGDSVSMVSEAAATGKPVFVFPLTERSAARRFRKFHQAFAQAGITRDFVGRLADWTYPSPDRTALIAALIREHLRPIP